MGRAASRTSSRRSCSIAGLTYSPISLHVFMDTTSLSFYGEGGRHGGAWLLEGLSARSGKNRVRPERSPEFGDRADHMVKAGRRSGLNDEPAVSSKVFVP